MITPINIISPINETTVRETRDIERAKNPPAKANGNEKMIIRGFLRLSNKHAITPKRRKNEMIKAIISPLNASLK